MPEPLRIEFSRATCHVMARGNQGQKTCLDDPDPEMWLATLVQTTVNRLVKIESLASAPAGSKRRLEFAYDFMGRRIWKKLTNLDTSAITEERFLHDAWNLVAVLSPSSATILK